MYRRFLTLFFAVFFLLACKKDKAVKESDEISSPEKFSYKMLNLTVDTLQYNDPLQLDLNQDNQTDFFLTSVLIENNDRPYLYLLINRKTPNLNRILIRPGEELPINGFWAVPMEKNSKIGETPVFGSQWSNDQTKAGLINISDNGITKTFDGEWLGKKDKYLGLKFIINGKYHYAWLRISHTAGEAKLAIMDYAYAKEAGKEILSGEK